MRRHHPEETAIPALHYHHAAADQLYRPISFAFVTWHMLDEIRGERRLVMRLVPERLHARQRRLFEQYDPALRADAFHDLLRLFAPSTVG